MFWDLMPIYISIEFAYAKDRNGCNLWEFVATNPGWQSNSYLCSYIVARFNSLLTFFRCKSLHSINCVARRNPTVCWNIFLEEYALLHLNTTGFSEVVRRSHGSGSLIPHMWDQWTKKNFFSHITFSATSWN